MKRYSLRDLINKVIWHPELDRRKLEIKFIDRPEGVSSIRGDEIEEVGHKFVFAHVPIPYHRILEIKYEGKVIWRKGEKVDLSRI